MDWKQFIAQIISSTAWPALVIIVLFVFKRELAKIIQRLAHLKYKDLELEFDKVKQQAEELHKDMPEELPAPRSLVFTSLEDQVLDAVERAPSAAILLAWSGLETAIATAVARLAISPEAPSYRSPMHNIEMLSKYGGLPKSYQNLLQEMRVLRNKVAHEKDAMLSITQDQALNYANVAIDMIQHLENLTRKG
jgi:uncharacterized protein YoxC